MKPTLRLLFALPCALLAIAAVYAADAINRREAKRERERLDALFERIRADIEKEDELRERETLRPTMRPVSEMRGVWMSPGGDC